MRGQAQNLPDPALRMPPFHTRKPGLAHLEFGGQFPLGLPAILPGPGNKVPEILGTPHESVVFHRNERIMISDWMSSKLTVDRMSGRLKSEGLSDEVAIRYDKDHDCHSQTDVWILGLGKKRTPKKSGKPSPNI